MARVKIKDKVWYVVCDDYTYGPTTEERAVHIAKRIDEGGHCSLEHRVERRPETEGEKERGTTTTE